MGNDSERGDLLRYLRSEPQTDRLAALQRGEDTPEPEAAPETAPAALSLMSQTGPLDDNEREHLRRLRYSPGWPVLLKLLDNDIRALEDLARQTSENNPLGNRDALAEQWAMVAILKRARQRLLSKVAEEIDALQHKREETQP